MLSAGIDITRPSALSPQSCGEVLPRLLGHEGHEGVQQAQAALKHREEDALGAGYRSIGFSYTEGIVRTTPARKAPTAGTGPGQ